MQYESYQKNVTPLCKMNPDHTHTHTHFTGSYCDQKFNKLYKFSQKKFIRNRLMILKISQNYFFKRYLSIFQPYIVFIFLGTSRWRGSLVLFQPYKNVIKRSFVQVCVPKQDLKTLFLCFSEWRPAAIFNFDRHFFCQK